MTTEKKPTGGGLSRTERVIYSALGLLVLAVFLPGLCTSQVAFMIVEMGILYLVFFGIPPAIALLVLFRGSNSRQRGMFSALLVVLAAQVVGSVLLLVQLREKIGGLRASEWATYWILATGCVAWLLLLLMLIARAERPGATETPDETNPRNENRPG